MLRHLVERPLHRRRIGHVAGDELHAVGVEAVAQAGDLFRFERGIEQRQTRAFRQQHLVARHGDAPESAGHHRHFAAKIHRAVDAVAQVYVIFAAHLFLTYVVAGGRFS